MSREFLKKATAFVIATTLIFGGYFFKDSEFVKAGYGRISNSIESIIYKTKELASTLNSNSFTFSNTAIVQDKDGILDNESIQEQSEAESILNIVANTIKKTIDGAMRKIFSLFETKKIIYNNKGVLTDSEFEKAKERLLTDSGKSSASQDQNPSRPEEKDVESISLSSKSNLLSQTQTQIINQPVIERIIETERIITVSGISNAEVEEKLQQLSNKLSSEIYRLSSANATNIINNYQTIALTNKIDKLGNVIISNSTISGTLTGLTDAHIPDSITISGYVAESGGTFTGAITNTATATSTFSGGLSVDVFNVSSTTATSTFANGLELSGGCFSINGVCVSGGGGSGTINLGTTNRLSYYSGATTLDSANFLAVDTSNLRFGIGTSTPWAQFSIAGASLGADALFTISTSTASATSTVFHITSQGYVGIGTTSPSKVLDVLGDIQASQQFISSISAGTAPLAVVSNTKVANLNADLLDGFDSSAFGDATAANQTTILNRIGQNTDVASMSDSLFAGQQYIWDNRASFGGTVTEGCYVEYDGSCASGFTSAATLGTWYNCGNSTYLDRGIRYLPPGFSSCGGFWPDVYDTGSAIVCCQ